MKQSIIKSVCAGFYLMASLAVTHCFSQELESDLLKMMPEIPNEITEPSQRAEYLVTHFWDKFNFRDTSFLMTNHLLERSFVEYIDLLSLVPVDTRDQSVRLFLKKSEQEERSQFIYILKLSEQYLYDMESPLCNEEQLIPFLQYAVQSPQLNDVEKFSKNYLLNCISKNRIGHSANDFAYTLINGETGTLHTIKADYTLLYFNDPECDDCRMLIKRLIASPVINQHIQSEKLKIIAFYVNDDLESWKKHAPDVLDSWIYAYDAEQKINEEIVYDIKQFPTLYLLDRDKKVIFKDINFEILEEYFKSL